MASPNQSREIVLPPGYRAFREEQVERAEERELLPAEFETNHRVAQANVRALREMAARGPLTEAAARLLQDYEGVVDLLRSTNERLAEANRLVKAQGGKVEGFGVGDFLLMLATGGLWGIVVCLKDGQPIPPSPQAVQARDRAWEECYQAAQWLQSLIDRANLLFERLNLVDPAQYQTIRAFFAENWTSCVPGPKAGRRNSI